MSLALGAAATSLALGLVLQPLLIPWLRRRGVMDIPNQRSSHATVTPRGGGLAVVVALGAGLLVSQPDSQILLAYLGCVALGALGMVDDFRGLDPKLRLALLLVVGGVAGAVLGSPLPFVLAVPMMALWTTTYVNAFNFMDGINGISGLTGVVAGASYWAMGDVLGDPSLEALGAALGGACLSFLPFNVPRARVFLGDVGSYAIGFAIAALAWLAWSARAPAWVALAPTLVYLADTGTTLLRRWRRGEPLTQAHREHAYQRLVQGGSSHVRVAVLVAGVQVGVAAVAWWAWEFGLVLPAALCTAAMLGGYVVVGQRASPLHAT